MTRRAKVLGLLALISISLVLRPAVAVIGPLLAQISESLSLTTAEAGILNASPVLCFGVGAFFSPWLVRRLGVDRAMMAVLVALSVAMAFRGTFGFVGLLIGTVAAGLSIASANVLLPTVVRRDFPKSISLVTGVYTTILAVSASFAASSALSLSHTLGSWQLASALWAIPGLLAIGLWWSRMRGQDLPVDIFNPRPAISAGLPLKSGLAWLLVLFFGIQSLGFYAVLGWLPSALFEFDFSESSVSLYLGVATAFGIPFGLLVSAFLGRFKSLSWWAAGASTVTTLGFLGLILALGQDVPNLELLLVACALLGMGQAATFPISLSLISIKASTGVATTQLSAMTQGLGYLLSALGTFVVGLLANSSGTWIPSFWLLVSLTAIQAAAGFIAGRPARSNAAIS